MPRLAAWMLQEFASYIIRGIERRKIFRDERDRENFLDGWESFWWKQRRQCYAGHFLGIMPLPIAYRCSSNFSLDEEIADRVCGQFQPPVQAPWALLQNRYKSIVCQEDTYFQELVRYIHLNH